MEAENEVATANVDGSSEGLNEHTEEWMCRRCHHKSSTKGNLMKHLNRQTPCTDEFEKIPIKEYLDELTTRKHTGKYYVCTYCASKYTTRQARHKHKKTCKARLQHCEGSTTQNIINEVTVTMSEPVEDLPVATHTEEEVTLASQYHQAELAISRETRNEQFYQRLLERHFNASHRVLESGITDITTDDCHIELKNWRSWQQAMGQLLVYNNDLKRRRLMACFFGDISAQIKSTAASHLSKQGIQCWEFINDQGRICLRDVGTSAVMKLHYLNLTTP